MNSSRLTSSPLTVSPMPCRRARHGRWRNSGTGGLPVGLALPAPAILLGHAELVGGVAPHQGGHIAGVDQRVDTVTLLAELRQVLLGRQGARGVDKLLRLMLCPPRAYCPQPLDQLLHLGPGLTVQLAGACDPAFGDERGAVILVDGAEPLVRDRPVDRLG